MWACLRHVRVPVCVRLPACIVWGMRGSRGGEASCRAWEHKKKKAPGGNKSTTKRQWAVALWTVWREMKCVFSKSEPRSLKSAELQLMASSFVLAGERS